MIGHLMSASYSKHSSSNTRLFYNIEWLRHAADPTIDEGGGPPISPDLAIGGPSWPRGRLQTTFYACQNLGASLTAPGDHSEPISDNLPRFRPLPTT